MADNRFDKRRNLNNHHEVSPEARKLIGSTRDKHPVYLEDGKTIIFISDITKEKETIERYKNRGFIKT